MGLGIGEGMGERLKLVFTPYYRSENYMEKVMISRMKGRYLDPAQPTGEEGRSWSWKFLFVVLMTACTVGLIMIVVGSLHAAPLEHTEEPWQRNCTLIESCGCPGEPMLPYYLIVGGALTIGLVLVRGILKCICQSCCARKRHENKSSACRICQVSFSFLFDVLAVVITALWLLKGTKYVLRLHERVNYMTHRPNQDTCDWGLYWFCLILIITGWIFLVFCLLCGLIRLCQCFSFLICCRPCR